MGDGGDFCLRDFLRMWHCGCFGIMAAEMLIPINGTNHLLGEKFIKVFFHQILVSLFRCCLSE
jgi:hypothetical protein